MNSWNIFIQTFESFVCLFFFFCNSWFCCFRCFLDVIIFVYDEASYPKSSIIFAFLTRRKFGIFDGRFNESSWVSTDSETEILFIIILKYLNYICVFFFIDWNLVNCAWHYLFRLYFIKEIFALYIILNCLIFIFDQQLTIYWDILRHI